MVSLFINWDVSPELISLGGFSIRYYGLLFALAFVCGYKVEEKMFKSEGLSQQWLDKLWIYVAVATVIGARLGHCFFYDWAYYSAHPFEIIILDFGSCRNSNCFGRILYPDGKFDELGDCRFTDGFALGIPFCTFRDVRSDDSPSSGTVVRSHLLLDQFCYFNAFVLENKSERPSRISFRNVFGTDLYRSFCDRICEREPGSL